MGENRFDIVWCCHTCGSKYHFIQDFSKPAAVIHNVQRIVKVRSRNMKNILIELEQQAEDVINHDDIQYEALAECKYSSDNDSQH